MNESGRGGVINLGIEVANYDRYELNCRLGIEHTVWFRLVDTLTSEANAHTTRTRGAFGNDRVLTLSVCTHGLPSG